MAVSAAIALAGLGYAVYGAVQKSKAEKAAKANKMPEYKIPNEEYDNLRLAEAHANQGISSQAYQAYMNNADRGLAATNSAILKDGGDANGIGNAYQKYNDGISNIAMYDDRQRQAHLSTLMAQNARMGSFGDKRYQLNEYAPFANRAQLYAQQQQAGNQAIGQGIGIAVQGAGQFAKSQQGSGNDLSKQNFTDNTPDNGQIPFQSAQNGYGQGGNYTPWSTRGLGDPSMSDPIGNGWEQQGTGYQSYYQNTPSGNSGQWNVNSGPGY